MKLDLSVTAAELTAALAAVQSVSGNEIAGHIDTVPVAGDLLG